MTNCRALVGCSLYPCRPGTPPDVTTTATWISDDTSVMRVIGAGVLQSVAPGHTLVRATSDIASSTFRPIGVFPGTPPLPTYEISGVVYEGTVTSRVPVNDATVEVLTGLVAGRTAQSGMPPLLLPGVTVVPVPTPGVFRIPGVPDDRYRIRVTKEGYIAQERDIGGTTLGMNDFYLVRQ